MLSHPAHTSTAWDFSFSLFIYQMPCKGDPCSLGIHIKLLSCIQTPLLNSHLPLVLSRNAEFERGKSVFIRGNLTLQSIVNKRRIRFRFVRLFMQGHDTESIFWHKQLEMGFGHWKFCPYLKNFCRETFVLLFHVILVSICCSPQPSICC